MFSVGCDFKAKLKQQLEKFVNKEADKFARTYIDILRKGEIEQAKELLDPRGVNSKTQSQLQKIANLLDKGELISIEVVGVNVFRNRDRIRNTLTYQLQFKDAWILTIVTVEGVSKNQKIYKFQVKPIPRSLEEINAFTFSGKSFRHYIILLIAIGIPVFIIYTIVLCVRTKMKRKWLWIIFMLFGIGKYSFNWTSGLMGFMPLAIQLIPTSAFKGGPYAPWIINISVPIGALAFILKRRKIRKSESVEVSMAPDSNDVVTDELDS
ncbi:MAG: hypothetical protein ACYSR9_04765 [Planctomycetota bacterium]|jgi:hypothetical protein